MDSVSEYAVLRPLACLAGCAVREEVPDREKLQGLDVDRLYQLAGRHMLTAAVGMALESCGMADKRFSMAVLQAQRRLILLEAEKEHLFAAMDQAGIWHLPLKGAVLKDCYPRFGMREMSDYDILFDNSKADEVREIMEAAGFKTQHFGGTSHDVYSKPPSLTFELHRQLFGRRHGDAIYAYYSNVEQRLETEEGKLYACRLRTDDFYIHMIAHAYKHYADKGTGLRTLLDVYVANRKLELNRAYIDGELEKLRLAGFERQLRSLAERLFDGADSEKIRDEMLDIVLNGGVYGSMDNRIHRRMADSGGLRGKLCYLLKRIFIPMQMVEDKYPFIWQHKYLLPLVPLDRLWKALTRHRERAWTEIRALHRYRG